jgi:colanic acid/amylovoran biosynthesis glycosyltransferase
VGVVRGVPVGKGELSSRGPAAAEGSWLRLGYLVPEFPGQTHAFLWRELKALRALGVDVAPLSTRLPPPGSCPHAFEAEARQQTRYLFPPRWTDALGELVRAPAGALRAFRYVVGLTETPLHRRIVLLGLVPVAAQLRKIARELALDHIHVHSCAMAAHVANLCKALGGPPFTLTLHGDLPVYGVDHFSKMRDAEFVVTVTQALRDQVSERIGLPADRLVVITMGVDTDAFVPVERVATRGRLQLVSVARLNFQKGHRFALRAMADGVREGLDLHYAIAGDGPERAAIEKEIHDLGLAARAKLLGSISESAVADLLRTADVLLLPTIGLGEAAPVAVMEAMACGVPSIASIVGGTPEMIRDAVDGFLVPQGEPEAILEALRKLSGDLELRRRVGAAARQAAVERFDYRSLAARFLGRLTAAAGPRLREQARLQER